MIWTRKAALARAQQLLRQEHDALARRVTDLELKVYNLTRPVPAKDPLPVPARAPEPVLSPLGAFKPHMDKVVGGPDLKVMFGGRKP